MFQQKWIGRMCTALAVLLIVSGCSSMLGSKEIDPPPAWALENLQFYNEGVQPVNSDTGPQSQQKSQMEVTLYYKDDQGFVVPLSVNMPRTESVARQSLEYMVDGGPGNSIVPAGFTALIPKGTEVRGIDVIADKKLAIVDFSKHFANYNVRDERKILEAITWTLTSFEAIDQVQLWLEGSLLKEMPMDGTPMDEPMTRSAMGINIEGVQGVDYGQSTPVTLYFQNQTADNFKYFVPVTRMIHRTEDVALAAMHELIKGPNEAKRLLPVISPDADVLEVDMGGELVIVDFDEQLLDSNQTASTIALQSLVLSLTENTGASQVQVKVNGSTQVSTDDEMSYSKPVTRPEHVNPYKL